MNGAERRQQRLQQSKRHLDVAGAKGQNIWAYAREHGLSSKRLYRARDELAQARTTLARAPSADTKRGAAPAGSAFVPVQVTPKSEEAQGSASSQGALRVRLPNGIVIECEDASLDVTFERVLFSLMLLLPCSDSTRG